MGEPVRLEQVHVDRRLLHELADQLRHRRLEQAVTGALRAVLPDPPATR